MKKILIFLLFFSAHAHAQTVVKDFFSLSAPEKWWVVLHPFKAKKALNISKDALKVTDSISATDQLDNDINGGQLDAFKHSFWMASLTQHIGKRSAIKLGEAHEQGNYISFKRQQLEDGSLPDKAASEMDLFNNQIGQTVAISNKGAKKEVLIEIIIKAIHKGEMRILLKNDAGRFLNCNETVIPKDSLSNTWENNKCLVPSNKKQASSFL